MIMFTITKPKGKLKKLLTAGALVLLLGVVVPGTYMTLSDVGAMSLFAAGDAIDESTAVDMAASLVQDDADEQVKQDEIAAATPENTDNAENAEITAEDTVETEKSGLLERLKSIFFGKEPQVIPY